MAAAASASRESFAKYNLITAREAAKRCIPNQELCQKFLRTFESKDGTPDAKFGYKKYKALLRRVANRHSDILTIELDDLAAFCRNEIKDPDLGGDIPKIELQQAMEEMVSDIETNTMRYMQFFYKAACLEFPPADEDFNREGSRPAKEIIQKWRENRQEQNREEGKAVDALAQVPEKVKYAFDVRFKPQTDAEPVRLREISAMHVGGLVKIDCLVVRVSQVKPKVEVVTYVCEVCEAEIFLTVEGERYTPPKECPSQKCKDNHSAGKLKCNIRACGFAKYQEMRVQEMSDHVPVGGVPRCMNVVLSGDLTRTVLPGDAITLTGTYVPYQLPWYVARKMGTVQEMYLEAHHVSKHKSGYNEENKDEVELGRKVDEAWARGNLYEAAAASIAPEIFGHTDVKKAMLLALIGSFTKTQKDGLKIRGDIHELFVGDPGVAKSQLLKQVCNIAPRSVYTTGKGSSGVGLTAAVNRDKLTGEVSLEGGALVLADMGVCCIDEFDKMDENDRTAIHEVMEQQSVSIAKSGITTTLNCRTTIMAAANPVYSRYNPMKSPLENVDLPASLISRFDLLFLLLDTVDPDKDQKLAEHVARVHHDFVPDDRADQEDGPRGDKGTDTQSQAEAVAFDASFMRRYIRKAKTFEPMIEEGLIVDIVDKYVSLREDEQKEGIDSRRSYTTPRTLLAILRLSQAHARARFCERVERQDFEEAIRLMQASKASVELSHPAKKGTNPLELVYDIVSDLSRRVESDGDRWVDMAHVVSMAGHKALSSDMVLEAIENWESLSVLCTNPEKTAVRFVVPPA